MLHASVACNCYMCSAYHVSYISDYCPIHTRTAGICFENGALLTLHSVRLRSISCYTVHANGIPMPSLCCFLHLLLLVYSHKNCWYPLSKRCIADITLCASQEHQLLNCTCQRDPYALAVLVTLVRNVLTLQFFGCCVCMGCTHVCVYNV